MKKLAWALLLWGCAPAAYEIVRSPTRSRATTDEPPPVVAPEPPTQSDPPVPPDDIDPNTPVQQEPPMCNTITVCTRRELPRCNKENQGLYARVQGSRDTLICDLGQWRSAD